MYILVDYDNLAKDKPLDVGKGLVFIVDKLINKITNNTNLSFTKIYVRLYGGWYLSHTKTKKAQDLSVLCNAKFREVFSLKDIDGNGRKVQVIVELACSLISNPYTHFTHTLRKRPVSFKLSCKHPINMGCQNQSCPLIDFSVLINSGICPEESCKRSIKQLLEKEEQKMVDTMISLDLEYLGRTYDKGIAVVSCDDDFLPAILVATRTKEIYHVRSNQEPAAIDYSRFLGEKYISLVY